MSTHKHFNLICVVVMIIAVVGTLLFMNGQALGLEVRVDADTDEYEEGQYFTENDEDGSWDTSEATVITLEGDDGSVSGNGAYFLDGDLMIVSSGYYVLSGELTDGSVIVETDTNSGSKVWILLDGVSINCEDDACIRVNEADKTFLTLAEGSENTLVSGTDYSLEAQADKTDGTIFAHDDLTINGSGSLTVTAGYKHGIAANDDLVITGGTITVVSAADGIHVNDTCNIENASITVSADDDAIHSDTSIYIASGTIQILSCYEGIEAPQIDICGGDITIYPTDDGINAGGGSSGFSFGGFGGGGFGGGKQTDGAFGGGRHDASADSDTSDADTGTASGANDSDTAAGGSSAGAAPDERGADDASDSNNSSADSGSVPELPEGMDMSDMTPPDMSNMPNMPNDADGSSSTDNDSNVDSGDDNTGSENAGSDSTDSDNSNANGGSAPELPEGMDMSDMTPPDMSNMPDMPNSDGSNSSDSSTGSDSSSADNNSSDGSSGDNDSSTDNDSSSVNGGNMPELPEGMDSSMDQSDDETESTIPTVRISGGVIRIINETGNDADGIDSNGDIIITGGEVYISLKGNGSNCALDYGSENGGNCRIDGGIVVAAGGSSMLEEMSSGSAQASILYLPGSNTEDETEVSLTNADGEVILSYTVPISFSSVVLSCPQLQTGESYTVTVGETSEEVSVTETAATYGQTSGSIGGMGGMSGMHGMGGGTHGFGGRDGSSNDQNGTADESTDADSADQNGTGQSNAAGGSDNRSDAAGGSDSQNDSVNENGSQTGAA